MILILEYTAFYNYFKIFNNFSVSKYLLFPHDMDKDMVNFHPIVSKKGNISRIRFQVLYNF